MKWVTRVDTIRHILKLDLKLFVNHGSEISYCFLFIKYKVKKGSQEAEKTYEVEPQLRPIQNTTTLLSPFGVTVLELSISLASVSGHSKHGLNLMFAVCTTLLRMYEEILLTTWNYTCWNLDIACSKFS